MGLPGSGKSTIGRRLARRFEKAFLDADREIERTAGATIAQIFERSGEDGFRDLERSVIETLLREHPGAVIATGGGAVLRETTRDALRSSSTVLYLRCSAVELRDRVRDDGRRPLFAGVDVATKLEQLFAERDALYAATAHVVVEGRRGQFARAMAALAERGDPALAQRHR